MIGIGSAGLTLTFLLLFILVQRWLHTELQTVLLILTRRKELALGLFSLLLLPGVVLHEGSHFLAAFLLGVKTRRFSIFPKILPRGKMRLGYVETAHSDIVRDSIIGSAPFVVGVIVISWIGMVQLDLSSFIKSFPWLDHSNIFPFAKSITNAPDFWLWFYLVFAISSTMLPSSSDRKSWFPLIIIMLIFTLISLLTGAGGWIFAEIVPWITLMFESLLIVLIISLGLHLFLSIMLFLLRAGLSLVLGVRFCLY